MCLLLPHWTRELVFGLGFREEMVILLVLCPNCGVCVCLLLPHWTWELVFCLVFWVEMVALLWVSSYSGVCVYLLLPPLDVGASVWSCFKGRDGMNKDI